MGCNLSAKIMDKIETPNTINKNKCLAGKFNRTEIPKELWLSRMRTFIEDHVSQLKHYTTPDINIIYQKLYTYEKSTKMLTWTTNMENKHAQAVKTLSDIFRIYPHPSPKQIQEELLTMALDYCINNKEHEFEEIAFVFSIIVNSPMIKFYETKY